MSGRHFIYTHTSPSGKVYVGQTVNIKRRWGYNGEHYKNKKKDGSYIQASFARAIDKYGWNSFKHEIILEGISKSEADYAEKYLIKWYKIHGMSYNITEGGEGTLGVVQVLTPERRAAISEFMRHHHPMKGKHLTPETLAKVIAANRNRVYTQEQRAAMAERARRINTGRKASEEAKKKMSDYRKSHPETWIGGWNKQEVHQYDLKGNYIASYPSATDAAIAIGKSSSVNICKCIGGKVASAGGYLWRKEKVEYIDMSNYKVVKTPKGARVICLLEADRLRRSAAHGKGVNQYSLAGEYLASYCSASEAYRQTGVYHSCILRCCKHEYRFKTAGGYRWEYDNINNRINISNMNHDNAEANTIEREKLAEEARQFDAQLALDKKKQADDARLKEKQIDKSSSKKG